MSKNLSTEWDMLLSMLIILLKHLCESCVWSQYIPNSEIVYLAFHHTPSSHHMITFTILSLASSTPTTLQFSTVTLAPPTSVPCITICCRSPHHLRVALHMYSDPGLPVLAMQKIGHICLATGLHLISRRWNISLLTIGIPAVTLQPRRSPTEARMMLLQT